MLSAIKSKLATTAMSVSLPLLAVNAFAQVPEIVIGAPNSLSGGYAEGGRTAVAGLKIAIDEINARGGIKSLGGAKLKLIPADASSDNPAQAATVTRCARNNVET